MPLILKRVNSNCTAVQHVLFIIRLKFSHVRDEQADEYTRLRKGLEQSNKNCRILSFKLRKVERKTEELENERSDLEKKYEEVNLRRTMIISKTALKNQLFNRIIDNVRLTLLLSNISAHCSIRLYLLLMATC